MKKFLVVLFVCVMCLSLCGCIHKKEDDCITIKVGISADYPPYENLEIDGTIVGFDADMCKLFEGYLTEKYGKTYKLELVNMSFDTIIVMVQGSQVDVGISGFSWSEDRVGQVDFTNPYCLSKQVCVVKKGAYTSLEQLNGKTIFAQAGTTGVYGAEDLAGDDGTVNEIGNAQTMMLGLAQGQADGAVVDYSVAMKYAQEGDYEIIGEPLIDEENLVVVKVGNTEMLEMMNYCIEKFIASDDYATLCQQYGLLPLE